MKVGELVRVTKYCNEADLVDRFGTVIEYDDYPKVLINGEIIHFLCEDEDLELVNESR